MIKYWVFNAWCTKNRTKISEKGLKRWKFYLNYDLTHNLRTPWALWDIAWATRFTTAVDPTKTTALVNLKLSKWACRILDAICSDPKVATDIIFIFSANLIFFYLSQVEFTAKMELFLYNAIFDTGTPLIWLTPLVPTHNKHIFVGPKKVCLFCKMCLFWENVLILGSGNPPLPEISVFSLGRKRGPYYGKCAYYGL